MSRVLTAIRTRAEFDRLSRTRDRSRSGAVWVRWAPPVDGDGVSVAFAVSGKVGTAVVRNRIRRRLRAVLRDIDDLPAGSYLIGVTPAAARASFAELRDHLVAATGAASATASPESSR